MGRACVQRVPVDRRLAAKPDAGERQRRPEKLRRELRAPGVREQGLDQPLDERRGKQAGECRRRRIGGGFRLGLAHGALSLTMPRGRAAKIKSPPGAKQSTVSAPRHKPPARLCRLERLTTAARSSASRRPVRTPELTRTTRVNAMLIFLISYCADAIV